MDYKLFDEDLIDKRLEELSKKTGRPKSFFIEKTRNAIFKNIEDIEDYYTAVKVMEDSRAGRTKAIPIEEVMRKYGMEC